MVGSGLGGMTRPVIFGSLLARPDPTRPVRIHTSPDPNRLDPTQPVGRSRGPCEVMVFSLSSPKRVAWYIIMIEKEHCEYSCEIEDFVKAHILCKLCVMLRSLVLLGVSSLRIFSRSATPLRTINSLYQGQVYYSLMSLTFAFFLSKAWNNAVVQAWKRIQSDDPVHALARAMREGRGDAVMVKPQWNMPLPGEGC